MIALKVISAHPDHLTLILVLLEYLLVQMNKQQTPINIEVSDDDKSLFFMINLIRTIRQSELFLFDLSILILFFVLLLLSSFSYIYIEFGLLLALFTIIIFSFSKFTVYIINKSNHQWDIASHNHHTLPMKMEETSSAINDIASTTTSSTNYDNTDDNFYKDNHNDIETSSLSSSIDDQSPSLTSSLCQYNDIPVEERNGWTALTKDLPSIINSAIVSQTLTNHNNFLTTPSSKYSTNEDLLESNGNYIRVSYKYVCMCICMYVCMYV